MPQRKIRFRRVGLVSGLATVLVSLSIPVSAAAAAATMTLSAVSGPSGGGGTVVGTVASTSSTPVPFPAGPVPTIQFQFVGTGGTLCSVTAKAVTQIAVIDATATAGALTVDPGVVRRITNTKVVFEVPSSAYPSLGADGNASQVNSDGLVLMGGQVSAKWNVCVYDSDSTTSSSLIASASYTLAARPIITSVIPASSPAGGGQSITVNGTGFSTAAGATIASIGGVALANIRVATNGNSFTATTGPRAAGAGLALSVSSLGGTVSSLDPDNDSGTNDAPITFTYSNGISITPNTSTAGSTVTLDVMGAGFSGLTFEQGGDPTSTQAHVFLVKDAYDAGANRGVAECVVLTVVGDSELICTLDLSADQLSPVDSSTVQGAPIAEGAYMVTVVANGSPGAGSDATPSIVSSGAAFIVAPY